MHIELRSVVPSLKSKQTNKHIRTTKTNERRFYHSWAKMSAAHVCAQAHCSTKDECANRQKEEGKKTCCPTGLGESKKTAFQSDLRSARDPAGSALQTTKNILKTQEHRVNKVMTNLSEMPHLLLLGPHHSAEGKANQELGLE